MIADAAVATLTGNHVRDGVRYVFVFVAFCSGAHVNVTLTPGMEPRSGQSVSDCFVYL